MQRGRCWASGGQHQRARAHAAGTTIERFYGVELDTDEDAEKFLEQVSQHARTPGELRLRRAGWPFGDGHTGEREGSSARPRVRGAASATPNGCTHARIQCAASKAELAGPAQ